VSAEIRLRKFGPLVAAVLAVAVVARVWDIRAPLEVEHDQASYLLQAEIFASGRWTVPSPPIPEFFEQPHVQLVPAMASKYPPGHALALAPGSLVGAPWLIPLVLTGVTAALLFALVARTISVWAAPFACVFWMTAPIVLRFQGSYFSETTTAALTLAGWWCILEWREKRAAHWLALAALAIGWSAITRPLTALLLAIPVGMLVLRDAASGRRWRDVAIGVAVGTAVLGIIPLWSAKTTGSWRETPLIKYQRDYLPFDKPGFTVDSTPPRRLASFDPGIRHMYQYFLKLRTEQSPAALPGLLLQRLVLILADWFQGFRLVLIVFAAIGLVKGGPPLRFAALSGALLVLGYLSYAHWYGWTIYYLELAPVAAAATAAGVWFTVSRYFDARRAGRVAAAAAAAFLVLSIQRIETNRVINHNNNRYYRRFAEAVEALPNQPAIVFAYYNPRARIHRAVVRNFADLQKAAVWIVHDLGARNRELMAIAPNRAVYYLEADKRYRETDQP
jgi:4-amino-4-deoxy-L-arabinose transferase-like glycosyltransferase